MWKRHQLVVGAVGACLLAGSIVLSSAGVSGATTNSGDRVAAESGRHGKDRDRDRDHRDRDHRDRDRDRHGHHRGPKGHKGHKHHHGDCPDETTTTTSTIPEVTTTVPEETTTVPEETTTVPEETTTVPEETTTVPEETTTVPEETTTVPEVGGVTTIRPVDEQPEVLGISQETPEVQAAELAFTGVSTSGLLAAGAGLLLVGLALVSGVIQRSGRRA